MNYTKLSLVAGVVMILFVVAGHAADRKKEPLSKPRPVPVVVKKKPTIEITQSKPTTGEQINWQVISSGATDGSSTSFQLKATAGQTAVGTGGSPNFGLSHGFWWEPAEPASPYLCGDASGDEAVNIGDAVYLINYIFKGGPAPNPLCVGDADGDDAVNIGDAVHLINYIFKGGPAPVDDCCQ